MSLPKGRTLNTKERLEIVLQVVEKNKPVSRVCKRAGISRSFFYKLKKQYLQAGESRKEKLKALEPRKEWIRRGKQLSRAQIKEILKVVLKNPEYGITGILRQIYANKRKKIVSHGGIQTFLLKANLNTKRKRRTLVKWARSLPRDEVIDLALLLLARYKTKEPLSPEERLKALRLVDDGVPIAQVCRSFQITRKNFYKWQQRYNQAVPGKEYQAVTNREPIIERYWRQATDEQIEAVLKIVIKYPEYSTHKVCRALPKIVGKSILGNHGVQNVFRRLNLNTYEKRLAYAQAQAPVAPPLVGLSETIKRFIGKIPAISAIPPPAREKITPLARPFVASFLTSIAFSTIFIYWLGIVSQAPTFGAKLGLLSATIALFVGSIFFAYSMKYYLTLAIVLSFSRQPLEKGGGYTVGLNGRLNGRQGNGNARLAEDGESRRGWLARIFGLGNGPSTSSGLNGRNGLVQAGGLQPSLEHIKLKRYPFVSIHLPFYNEKKVAERILKACTAIDYPNFEIIVCDDSTDETTAIVQDFAARWNAQGSTPGESSSATPGVNERPLIKVLHRKTRQGFKGGALGYALKHMNPKTEFVVVFDADFIPYPDTLTLFIKYFQANGLDLAKQKFTSEVSRRRNTTSEVGKGESNLAVVAGYQWHVLNKSENWITRGVRTEYAGSYVIERPGREILGLLRQISGSVYMIRADLLKKFGWGTSITEDFQLTLKLYERGYKVIYTPYVQAPAECVSTLKRLIRQRMRWAEGHSNNIRRMFMRLMSSPKLTLSEKLEVLYLSPYYLQAFFFLVGTLSWLMAETVFRARLPFWTSVWGWSLVLTNFFSLPLVNAVGLFLEESEERDYVGILSFIFLSYILVPFQAYASVKGFLEKEEGPWFRTPKTGKITDIFTRGRFYRWISGILPGRLAPVARMSADRSRLALSPYVALATANNRFDKFLISRKQARWIGRTFLVILLIFSTALLSLAPAVPYFIKPKQTEAKGFGMLAGPGSADSPQTSLAKAGEEESKVTIKILNPYSHPKEGEDWVVNFRTRDRADLTITPMDQATVDDLDFVSLKCGHEEREPKIFDGPPSAGTKNIIFYPQWECNGEGSVTHRVNKSGSHTLKFQFGDQIAYAYNSVQVDTSTSANATAYSFQRKTWYDGTRLWSAFYSGTVIEFWYSTDWGSTWTQNSSATISVSTNDFTIEADSSNAFISYTNGYDIEAGKAADWSYRKSHVINSASGAGTNYQVRITAHYESGTDSGEDVYLNEKSRTDFGDVRLTDNDGTLLDYWIESKEDAASQDSFAYNGISQPFNFINYPSAVYYNNKTYITWQADAGLDPYITYYDHTNQEWGPVVKVASNPLSGDDHGGPAIAIDNNGYIHVFYGSHGSAQKHAKSDSAEDISSFTVQSDVTSNASYPKPIKDGNNMYLFYRKTVSASDYPEYYKKSTDNGSSWGSENTIIESPAAGGRVYVGHMERSGSQIHLGWAYANSGDTFRWDIYHAYFNISDGKMYSMNGTDLGTTITETEADTYCKVVDSSTDDTNIPSLHLDSSGYPWMIYVRGSGTSFTFYHVRWNGSSWTTPSSITTTDNKFNFADFIINSTTDVEAYLTTSGQSGRGGDIEKWTWNGSTWSSGGTILSESSSGKALNSPMIPVSFNSNLKMVFSQINPGYYMEKSLKLYAYSGSAFVSKTWGEAILWVEVADDLSSNQTIYVYYGKSDATTTSNGTNTFPTLFDAFSGASLDSTKWAESGDVTVSGGLVDIGGGSTNSWITTEGKLSAFSKPLALRTKSKIAAVNYGNTICMEDARTGGSNYLYVRRDTSANTTHFWFGTKKAGSYSGVATSAELNINYHVWETRWKTDEMELYYDDVLDTTKTTNIPSVNLYAIFPAWAASANGAETWADWVLIRKYVDPEPSHGSWGSEQSSTYPGTSFFWGPTTTVYDGSSTTDEYDYSAMTKDSNNKLWVTAAHHSSTNYLFKAIQSTNANDISAWETASTLDTSTNSNKYGTIVSLGSGNLYSAWIDGTAIEGKKYTSGTGWDASPTSIATGVTGLTNNMSAVSDSSGNVHLLYINSSDYAVYQKYTTSWQTAVTLDGTAGCDYATISINTSNSDLYALWIRSNVIYYKKGVSPYASANWDVSATAWKSTGTNTNVTSNYSGAGMIFAQWTSGTASPYSVNWDYVIIPENLWLFLILSPFAGKLMEKLKRRKPK